MDSTFLTDDYPGETAPIDQETQPQGPEGLNKESTNQNQNTFATGQKRQKWKYHEFESTLLEWLTFLAEHNVQVVKQEDLRIDKPNAEQGTSMRVYHGRWKEQPVVLKCPLKYDLQQIHKLAKNSNGGNENADKFTRILRDMMFEIQVMAHSPLNKHPNIIKLLAISFEDFITPVKHSSGGDFIHEIEIFIPILVVEAAVPEYSTLDRFFIANNNKIDFDQARTLICDIACGLAAVHQYGVIHGDVKDQNILLVKELYDGQTRLVAKISDFGASGIESSREDIRGMSEYWAAPEVLERPQGWKGLRQTSAADIYSFGLLAATIALGGRRLLNEVSESWSMKQNDKMKAYAKEKLQTFFRANLNLDDDATQVFLKQILDICDKTLAQDTAKRLSDLSVVPQMFGLEKQYQFANNVYGLIPYHSYGTQAHPGVKFFAPRVADVIYDNLPKAMKERLSERINRFAAESKDAQTVLIHVALKLIDDPTIPHNHNYIRELLLLWLTNKASSESTIPFEVDMKELGGFEQVYRQDILIKGIPEPSILEDIREERLEKIQLAISVNPGLRRVTVGARWNALHYAAYFDKAYLIELFATGLYAVDVDEVGGTIHHYTPLHTASSRGNYKCVKTLLDLGATVDPPSMTVGEFNFTPLSMCVTQLRNIDGQRAAETIKLLLEAGASPLFRKSGLGITHLLAQSDSHGQSLTVVLQYDARLKTQLTAPLQTPLHSAAGVRNKYAVELLICYNAEMNARNIVGDTPLHNAYMSIGPATRPNSHRYAEDFTKKLLGSVEDAKDIIKMLVKAGADEEALGLDSIPWDTPEFRMYDEYEDASSVFISPANSFLTTSCKNPSQWKLHDWLESDFDQCVVFSPGSEKLDIEFDVLELTPNYYEAQVRVGVLEALSPSISLTLLVYHIVTDDTAEVLMSARVPLGQLELNRIFVIKLRGFIIKHRTDAKVHIYQELTPGRNTEENPHTRILLDWIAISKFNVLTQVGSSTSVGIGRLQ